MYKNHKYKDFISIIKSTVPVYNILYKIYDNTTQRNQYHAYGGYEYMNIESYYDSSIYCNLSYLIWVYYIKKSLLRKNEIFYICLHKLGNEGIIMKLYIWRFTKNLGAQLGIHPSDRSNRL